MAAHYALGEEAGRLAAAGSLERLRTSEHLGRVLPSPPADVLDVGGGAGVYAVPLTAEGYRVLLVDPVELHVQQARTAAADRGARLAGSVVGDARKLPASDESADAVLLLGPLYHLTERAERVLALEEAARALRPAGVLVVAAISRFASTLDGIAGGHLDDPTFAEIVERDVATGQHRNPTGRPGWFTTAYFHHPDELADEVAASGLTPETLIAVEGPVWAGSELEQRLADPARRQPVIDAIRRIEREPSLLGASPHVLAVARKSRSGAMR